MALDKDRVLAGKKLIAQYKKVFGTPDGKAVLYDLMRVNFLLISTFDPMVETHMLLREGQRNAILRILTLLKMDPEQYVKQVSDQEETHV